jgi:pleiotropic regulator 1
LQPGSLESESAIFAIIFDKSSTRMISAECDKSIKIWQENKNATSETHPIVFND